MHCSLDRSNYTHVQRFKTCESVVMLRVFPPKKTNRAFVGLDIILNRLVRLSEFDLWNIFHLNPVPFDLGSLLYIGNEKLPTYIYLELQTTSFLWLFQLDDSQSLHKKWLFHQTSIKRWLFRVPGIGLFRKPWHKHPVIHESGFPWSVPCHGFHRCSSSWDKETRWKSTRLYFWIGWFTGFTPVFW